MSFHSDDTICAIATAPGGAARGMIRISGPASVGIARRLFDPTAGRSLDAIHCATALPGRVRVDLDSSPRFLPCDLFLWPTKRSYTREPVAELHTIGSRPLLESLLTAVCRVGARLAEPGEFTLRAFLAGRLDLTQAEAVLGVIDARGTEELHTALAQLAGGLARPLHQLRGELLQLLAELEAGLDFADEDIEFVSPGELLDRLQAAGQLLEQVARQMASRHIASDARQIALVGPPNVGKSSLFNALVKLRGCTEGAPANQPAPALVSPQRGTTRDYLTATISLDGAHYELVDTAGTNTDSIDALESCDPTLGNTPSTDIDVAAQAVAARRRKGAAIRALCIEAFAAMDSNASSGLRASVDVADCDLIVLTKSDLGGAASRAAAVERHLPIVLTSSRTAAGLDELCDVFRSMLALDAAPTRDQVVAVTADRCRECIRLAKLSLLDAADTVKNNVGNELVAVELRAALGELGKVVGAVYTDDLLERIFSTFCIGK